jgi:hypothetical protein
MPDFIAITEKVENRLINMAMCVGQDAYSDHEGKYNQMRIVYIYALISIQPT